MQPVPWAYPFALSHILAQGRRGFSSDSSRSAARTDMLVDNNDEAQADILAIS